MLKQKQKYLSHEKIERERETQKIPNSDRSI